MVKGWQRPLVAVGALVAVLAAWAGALLLRDRGDSEDVSPAGVSRGDFDALALGTSRTEVEGRVGPRGSAGYAVPFGQTPAGVTCDFHPIVIEAALPVPGYNGEVRLCFRGAGGRAPLAQKAWSDGECVYGRTSYADPTVRRRCP